MTFTTTIISYHYTIWGIEKGRKNSTFENCYIADKEYTDEQILFLYNAQCNGRCEATECRLDKIEYITIDLLRKEIVKVESEDI